MKIQMGVNKKMKLYNVYRLCKENLIVLESAKFRKDESGLCSISSWSLVQDHLNIIKKIPSFKNYINDYISSVPVLVRENVSPQVDSSTAQKINSKLINITDKMKVIIELYENMNIKNGEKGLDIKLPPCDNLKDYISYLKDIDFIFSQCPFLQCESEILKFGSVDVGSNWIKLTLATASTCMILNNTAVLMDKALILRSHYISIEQQEETLKSIQLKNELTSAQIETFNLLRKTYMNTAISLLENDIGKLDNPEERDKAERSLEKLELLLERGCEIYATLDAPEEIQALFPEIQGNLELPDNIMNYLEDKEEKIE